MAGIADNNLFFALANFKISSNDLYCIANSFEFTSILAQRFDVRNGNQELSARRTALLNLRTSVVSWSLSDDQT